ncbi:MAG: aromatic ring-hydroxylating dioxygenase subunit alpha [Acidobacteriota bacterium]
MVHKDRAIALTVESEIRSAHTLPSSAYCDDALYRRQVERIFARSWQFLGDVDLLAKTPGTVHPLTLLPGSLDEPLVVTRDADDALHVLSNVCTHRAMLVCEHPGRARHLRCRYHGRRFDLDGRFRHMPEFDDVEDFPSPADNLPRLAHATWGRFLFAAVDPAISFEDWLGPVRARLPWLPFDRLTFDPARSRDYLVQAHWALYCDNYLEGFHIPFVHSGLDAVLDYGAYEVELEPWASLQLGVAADGGDATFDLPASSPDAGRDIAAYYYFLFPNLMLNVYPWGVSINLVEPLGPARTKVRFLTWVSEPSLLDQGAGAGLDRVEREDEEVVEGVQRGVRSRFYDRGRYAPRREPAVHHFHRLLADALA